MSQVILQELGPDPLLLELAGADLPLSAPRERAAWESGGEQRHSRVDLDGADEPFVQLHGPTERDLVLSGAFRDHQHARPGHARAQRDLAERIRARGRRLRITWAGEEREVLLTGSLFGEESAGEITYQLTLLVFRAPASARATPRSARPGSDRLERAAQRLVTHAATLDRLPLRRTPLEQLSGALTRVTGAMTTAHAAVRSVESGARQAAELSRRAIGVAQSAQQIVRDSAAILRRAHTEAVLISQQVTDIVAWSQWQFGALGILDDLGAELWATTLGLRARQRAVTRLYVVRLGDTLESIARSQLGDARRAPELGLRADQLAPGLVIRIPFTV